MNKDYEIFTAWYEEECHIEAAERVGPNSFEYEALLDRLLEDETRKENMRHRYNLLTGGNV